MKWITDESFILNNGQPIPQVTEEGWAVLYDIMKELAEANYKDWYTFHCPFGKIIFDLR